MIEDEMVSGKLLIVQVAPASLEKATTLPESWLAL